MLLYTLTVVVKMTEFDYLGAYYAPDMKDESGVTIMVNQYVFNKDHPNNTHYGRSEYDDEECFEGGNCKLAEEICNEFNKLLTKDIYDFYDIREDVFKKHNFRQE